MTDETAILAELDRVLGTAGPDFAAAEPLLAADPELERYVMAHGYALLAEASRRRVRKAERDAHRAANPRPKPKPLRPEVLAMIKQAQAELYELLPKKP